MATRFSRIALLVVFALGGAALIQTGFPGDGVSAEILPSPSPVGIPGGGTSTDGAGGDGGGSGGGSQQSPSAAPTATVVGIADFDGLRIAVYNGTSVTGLAADTMTELTERFGFVNAQTGNSEMSFQITEIRFAEGYEEYALLLAREYFGALAGAAVVEPLDPAIADTYDVVLQITLGADWAAEA